MRRLIALAAALLMLMLPACASADLTARFIDVGQGDACLITCDGEVMLVDGGTGDSSSLLVSLLRELGIDHIDHMVATHPHYDHVGGLSGPLNTVSVGAAYCNTDEYDEKSFANYKKYVASQGLELKLLAAGDELTLGGAQVHVLAPTAELENMNDNSIVLRVVYGSTSMLLMADCEREGEKALLASGCELDSDLIKAGHHGASDASGAALLERVSPEYAVISVGKGNDYNHPHKSALNRLDEAGAHILRTDVVGTVTVVSDGSALTVSTGKAMSAADGEKAEEYYIGNRRSKKFHSPSCKNLPADKNRVILQTREEAVQDGYSPCGNCKP